MAKKKKVEIPERKVIWHIQDDGSVSPIIQNQKQDIAPVQTKQSGFFKGSDAKNNWSIETDNPFMNAVQRANATLWGTILDAGTNVVRGATSSVEGIGDFAQNRVADVQDLFGHNKAAEKTRRKSEQVWGINQKIDDFDSIMNTTSVLGDKSDAVFQGVGTSLFAMGTGALGGAIGGTNAAASILSLGTMGLGAAGNSENQARQEMMADLKKYGFNTKQINNASRMYGLLSGVGETLSEMMFGGISQTSKVLGIGSGVFDSADDAVINALTKRLKTGIFKNFVQAGLKASGEGVEEIASGFLDAAAKKLTYMKDEDFGKLLKDEKLLDSFISGTLSATLTQLPSYAKSVGLTPSRSFKAYSNNEIRDFVSNLNTQEQQVVEREIENRLAQEENPTNRKRMQIEKQVIEDLDRGYISANTIRETLGENYNPERDLRLNESFNEEIRRSQAYENDTSKYDEKQRATIQRAIDSGLLNNSNKTHDFVDLIAKLSADKGIDFDFTNNERIKESGFAIDGRQVNGFVKDGTVNLNLESNQVLNKTVGHEITHVLEGTDLYDSLQQSLKAYIGEKEWNNRISQLEKVYQNVEGANIENELTSDLVGEHIFNDENFIKNLSTNNQNLFQKIFDEIKYMVKIATAGSKEARDLEKVKRAFEKAYRETSKTQQGTQYSIKESKKALENQFKELTGDSMLVADAKLGNYAFQQIQGREVEAPYSKEAMDLYEKIQDSKQTSSHLYHSTPVDRIQSIVQNGLQVGSQQNQEGVSSTDKLYLSATEELAESFTPNDSVTLRISPNANLENLDNDLLGGEGSYTITNNIDPKYLQVKENGKWVNLLKSQYAKQNNQNTKYSLTDNQNNESEKITLADGRTYNNYYEYAKDITKNKDELAKELLFKHYSQNFDVPANSNETKFYHGTDATFDYDGLKVMDFDEQTMDRNYGDYFYITTDKDFSHTYGSQIAEFIIPNDKILSLEDYRQNYSNKTDDELFNDYWALEMPDNEYIVKDIKPIIDYSKQRANDYINQQENTQYSLSEAPKQDNQGRELTKNQQEFYKDVSPEVRDENGNLMSFYHGSNSEFTIFDITKSGESSKEAKVGFWFTPNKKGADNFANEVWYGDKTPTTYEVYLNIKNPKVYETYEVDQQQRDNMIQNRKNIEQEIRESSRKYSWTETGDYKVTSLYNDLVEMNRREKNGIRFKEDAQYNEEFYRRLAEERNIPNEKFNEMNQDAKNQVELETQKRKADDEFYSYVYSDAYEQFKTDLYLSAGMRAEDANVGGMGMMMKNENEAVANFVEGLKQEGYDGIVIKNTHYDNDSLGEGKNNNQYVAFYPNQIKNIDNKKPTSNQDIRYSLTDNQGRQLSEQQQEYFKDSKAVDENGNLVTVYHTMTNTGNQFFEFNPVGTDFYRFGEQAVNYFTDNQDMSGSYADSNYKRAYTKPIKSMDDVQDFIKFQNTQNDSKIGVNGITSHYSIEKNGNGFTLKQTPSGKEFLGYDNLSEEGKVALKRLRANESVQKDFEISNNPTVVITDTLKGWDIVREYKGYPELAELVELYDRESQKLIATGTTYEEQMVIREILKNDLENYLFGTQEYSDEKINEVIERSLTKQFENEQDLIDNIQNNFQAKYQYAGYINMTNPYVIDTFGENWDSVTTERNEAKSSEYNRVVKDNETKEKLYNLAQESERLFKEYSQSNKPREFAEYSIIKNKINNSELREVVNDMGMFGLTYEGWLEAGKKNAELFGEEYKQTLPNSDEKISNYTESLNPAEQELVQDLTIGEFVNRYGELYKENMKFGNSSSYFKDQFRTTTGTTLDTDKIGYTNMFDLARYNFDGSSVSELLDEKLTTNDLVKRIIEKNNSGETNYDGLIMKNVYDYGGKSNKSYRTTGDLYVTFNSNQFKAVDNLNPTDDADIRYQLGNNEVTPTSGWNVRSEDVRLQSAFKDTIAPLQEQVQQLNDTINRLEERIAPLSEQEADELYQDTQRGFENELAPTRENLTQEENQRLDMLDLLERNNMLTDEQRYEREQLQSKENPINLEQEVTPGQALSDVRDAKEIGSPKVKAYQYEHPEVKPYFQEEARRMLSDLDNTTSGGRYVTERTDSMYGDWHGIKRFTSPEIAALLDGEYGAKYQKEDIRKGLNAIIEDHGAENIAVAKRIELVLDERLRNGYDAWGVLDENGEQYHVAPNSEYLNMLAEQEWQNYFDDIANQYPIDDNQAQYALEQERQQEEQYKIDKSLEDMTADDINLEPFLEGLQGARERQAERQQQREEINQKKEVKIPKQSNGRRAVNRGLGLLVNEFAVLDDYSKQTKNKDIKFKTDTYNNYQAIAQSNIETAQTDINGKRIGRSGNSIFEEAKRYGLADTFDEYLKQWANVDRAKQGKGAANFSAKESYKIVKEMEAKNPRLKKLGADMWQYYRNARHNLRDAGIISQEVSDMLGRMYPHYTPYISENIENYFVKDGELKPKATIKRAKGGAAIGSLLSAEEAMQRYTKSEFNTIFGNDLFKEIVNTSNDIVQLGGDDRGMQFVNADNLYADKNGYYLTAYENGNPITAKISEDMYRTLTRESRNRISDIENTFSAITKPLQAASNIRRNILTSWSPTFMAKNFIKDFQEGIFNSKYTKDFIKNYPSAFKELATNTELAQQFKSLYGSGLTMGQYDIDANNYNPSGKNRNFLKGIKNVNELIELAPRYAEFKASIDHGASIQEAMYNAREVTTNFSRGGTLAKALNRNGFTFLNSSIQGFDKFIRNFSGENGAKGIVNSLAKAAIFGIAPAVFNELAFGSGDDKDEEYEALPDYIKDNYYIIKTGDGDFIRIPKGRVFSVFGSAARRTIEAMEGEENAFEGYWNNVQQQIGINNPEENNIFAPLIQAMGGRKLDSGQTAGEAWYGGDIIPSRLQKERPEDQYDASIDKFSIWLGQRTGISPYKINYVLDQYTGGIGDIGLPMITDEANSDGSIIAPIKDQFTADTITDNKYVSEFYDTKNKLYTGSKATDEDILKSKYMNDISLQMGQLYAERRKVQEDNSLTKEQKYKKAQEIKKEINRLAKEGLDNYEKVGITGDYADTNGQEYQKTEDGWRKLNENTSDELNLLGLTSREKNNYIKTKQNISSIKEKYKDTDDYNGKKNEIIGEIINTNLDDNSKLSLYQDTYRDKLADSIDDLGISADTYLEYKAQDFSADKDKNGKSISGSKKQKVFDYINSMAIPYEQKLILAKSEYNSFNDNNAEIIEYIENSGMDYSERIELYKNLGFKVDGDNISW